MPDVYVPSVGPPQGPPPDAAIYAAMGDDGIRAMLRDFYRELARSPVAHLFPVDEVGLQEAADRSALFFVTVCGGPPLYAQKYGPPRMRARHLPFALDSSARRAWLDCWKPVLAGCGARYGFPEGHLEGFRRFLDGFSAWMVNRAG
ncbi:MAG: hypothetical protein ACREKE_03960 [bacterium]